MKYVLVLKPGEIQFHDSRGGGKLCRLEVTTRGQEHCVERPNANREGRKHPGSPDHAQAQKRRRRQQRADEGQ